MTLNPPTKRLLRGLRGEPVDRPPFWLMRQAGRYLAEYQAVRRQAGDFLTLCYTPEHAVEVTLQPIRRFGMDAAILFSDILVVPDALGQKVAFRKGEGPVLQPFEEVSERLRGFDPVSFLGHLQPVYDTVARLRAELPEETTLIGFAGAPWTVATYMVEGRGGTDFGNIKRWAYADPDGFDVLMARLVDATTAHLDAQIQHGAEVVQLFDTWAGALSESQFRRWAIAPTAEIVRRLKMDHPDVPVIGFPRAAGALYVDYVRDTGVDGVSLDAAVPLAWARDVLQPICALQGNLDNQLLIVGGEAMEREIERVLQTLGNGPFVFNLGHGILPQTPPAHVARLAEIIRDWRPGGKGKA